MSAGRSASLIFLGIVLGIGLSIGTYYGVREYAPDLAARYLVRIAGAYQNPGSSPPAGQSGIDSAVVKSIVQDVLASPQGRAILWDLIKSQSGEDLDTFFREAMESPEFRGALTEALNTFLQSPEGKALLRRIANEVLGP